ncbi:hypothetical protein E1162_14360 [Rhodobacteraceae bacterium RKSG542]|uniref:hypothetical protein n=1 Tax=Pseudovibrio flavus TaxID=2529854 RepID=UPI0012BCD1BE|nr:hypothetical protein [Pseudovibrio flavus]MTI18424.1 hypothetical protein [Pseudovibrio flavus]
MQYALFSQRQPKVAASSVAQALGLEDRFAYWHGRSGQRYLFTRVPADELEHYSDSLVLVVKKADQSELVWSGQLDQDGQMLSAGLPKPMPEDCVVLLHFLATGDEDRKAAFDDLALCAA